MTYQEFIDMADRELSRLVGRGIRTNYLMSMEINRKDIPAIKDYYKSKNVSVEFHRCPRGMYDVVFEFTWMKK